MNFFLVNSPSDDLIIAKLINVEFNSITIATCHFTHTKLYIPMAAECLGAPFFHYSFQNVAKIEPNSNKVVWVNQRYTPTDLRSTAPAQRWKFMVTPQHENFARIPDPWKQEVEPPSKLFARDGEELRLMPSSHATRCEEWSTLRQMLPSRGQLDKVASPRWGTGGLQSSLQFRREAPTRFPHINSPMTR